MADRNPNNIKPGDWVRFYQAGRMVIGVVQYLHDDGWRVLIQTDHGVCNMDDILECREAK